MTYDEMGPRNQVFPPKKKLKAAEVKEVERREIEDYENVISSDNFKLRTLDQTEVKKDVHVKLSNNVQVLQRVGISCL